MAGDDESKETEDIKKRKYILLNMIIYLVVFRMISILVNPMI